MRMRMGGNEGNGEGGAQRETSLTPGRLASAHSSSVSGQRAEL